VGAQACRAGTRRAWRAAAARDRAGVAPEAAPSPTQRVYADPNADPVAALGGGVSASPYPLNHYMFDIKIDTGLDDVTGNFFAVFQQSLLQPAWMALLYLLRLAMRGLELSFELNLVSDAMGPARAYLERARLAITEPWLLAAISAAGLWGIWRGLVQGRIAQTVGGLALSLGLMVGGLYLIANPAGTIGAAGAAVDRGAAETIAALTGGPGRGSGALPDTERGLFAEVITPAWCALQFGSAAFCAGGSIPAGTPNQHRDGYPAPTGPADLWLRWPANGPERDAIYKSWRDGDAQPHRRLVRQMQKEATGTRVVMLILVAAGLLGAVLLFGLIAFRLVSYALLALVLLMLTPAMLLVAALGDAGRRAVAGWAHWLIGCLLGKLIYAVLLAVMVLTTGILAALPAGGWIGSWLLLGAFWWAMIVQRNRLVEWLSAGAVEGRMQGGALRALGAMYLGGRLVGAAGRAGAVPVAGARRSWDRIRTRRSDGARRAAEEGLNLHAERALSARLRRDRGLVDERERIDRELAGIDRALAPAERARLLGERSPLPEREEGELRFRRAVLETRARAAAPGVEEAKANLRRVADNRTREGREWSEEDLAAERARLARADAARTAGRTTAERLAQVGRMRGEQSSSPPSPPAPGALRDAGISPESYRAAPPELRGRMDDRVLAGEAERAVLGWSAPEDEHRLAPSRGAREALGLEVYRRHHAEARKADALERRAERRRRRLHRAPRI
jgi:hypothetical protein